MCKQKNPIELFQHNTVLYGRKFPAVLQIDESTVCACSTHIVVRISTEFILDIKLIMHSGKILGSRFSTFRG